MMYKIILALVIMGFVAGCDNAPVGYSNISVKDAHVILSNSEQAGKVIFLDVRTPGEFNGGHVPSAINIPVQTLGNRLAEVPKDKQVIVYCESGVRASKAAAMLVDAGFTNIKNMKASMRGWRSAGFETK